MHICIVECAELLMIQVIVSKFTVETSSKGVL